MGGEQPGPEEAMPIQIGGRPNAMVLHHELELGTALVQVDRVSHVVLLGEGSDGLQQRGR